MTLEIKNIHVGVEGIAIVKGVSLTIKKGEVHVIMGPNGSGKSTLAQTLAGNKAYTVTQGNMVLDDFDITAESPDSRAKKGLFLSFQYPAEIPGVTMSNFLRTAVNSKRESPVDVISFRNFLKEKMKLLHMDVSFADRYVNHGFSGGEKKRAEILQLAVLEPSFAVLDETDSGADVDSLQIMASGINTLKESIGVLLITHYNRILQYIRPDFVHVMIDGRLVRSGGPELAEEIEARGYGWLRVLAE
jgi:Fe-S cluster assembly ATP-binding protein